MRQPSLYLISYFMPLPLLYKTRDTTGGMTQFCTLVPFLQAQINQQNESKERMNQSGFITFVREGSKATGSGSRQRRNIDSIIVGSSDWKLLVDYDDTPIVFLVIFWGSYIS